MTGWRNKLRVCSEDDGLIDQVAQGVQDGRPGPLGSGDGTTSELASGGEEIVASGAQTEDVS